jgi:primosomal protein N'
MEQVRLTLSQGKSVLYLVPDIALSRQLEDAVESYFPQLMTYHSALSPARRRAVADYVRKKPASLVLGTRSALFLPHGNLGLVIVDQEHDISHKQDSPAPRYHARESAILLAGIHGAHVVLGSETPSLESVYNTETGRYQGVDLQDFSPCEVLLVHMSAEARKKGMVGSFSLKLLEQMHRAREAGKKVLLVCRSKAAIPEYEQELKAVLGPETKGIVLASPASARGLAPGSFGVVGILQADTVLAREDFRCDEKAVQALRMLMDRCTPDGILVIQTRESAHPVFREFTGDCSAHLLEERRQFGYPPYTRLVQLVLKDVSDKRRSFMAAELVRELRQVLPQEVNVVGPYTSPVNALETHIRLFLPRNKALLTCKKAVYNTFVSFEKNRKYTGHIHIDVDPV